MRMKEEERKRKVISERLVETVPMLRLFYIIKVNKDNSIDFSKYI
jgi:hypothetical protein